MYFETDKLIEVYNNVKDKVNIIHGIEELEWVGLEQRLDKTIEVFADNNDAKIIVSGGQGIGETISEAEAMTGYFIKNGVSQDYIIM